MNSQGNNPFAKIRTEQMGESAWKYFVEPAGNYIGEKPLIFEGSRGTGKTMFFICNSWKEKYEESKSSGSTLLQFLQKCKHIGFYYKVDGRFVKSLDKKSIEESTWTGIFNTYFNIIISKRIIEFVDLLIAEGVLSKDSISPVIKNICLRIKKENTDSLELLNSYFSEVLIEIEKYTNNTKETQPVGLNAGTIVEELLLGLKKNESLKSTTFHVFVDEYEVLNRNQQVELNTLLKQSDSNIVYDFGVITRGIQTYETASGQELRPKDDFSLLSTDRFGYYESDEYNNLLAEICKKRLKEELDKLGKPYNQKFLDINFYLKNYGKRYEDALFEKSPDVSLLKERLHLEIKRHARIYNYSKEDVEFIYEALSDCTIIQLRMHIALLLRKNQYAVPAKDLVEAKAKGTAKYKEWAHNTETAVIFLLCHELKVEKKYHGFQVYSALSSGVVRSFLELAEYAFDYAFSNPKNPFSFSAPREFTIEEQTKAVYFVSNFKIKEIDSYEPSGHHLKRFTIALGKIFHALHTNSNSTLGEVEHNHFETKVTELKRERDEAAVLLKHAIRHKILEEVEPTKTKSEEIIEFTDYHLNHVYCPAFRISHLRKRKIPIAPADLAKLFCGNQRELEDVVSKLSKSTDNDLPNLFKPAS
jgi:hypothetical protein